MKLGPLLAHLRELEFHAATELRAAAERHRADQDVFHQCHTFAVSADKRAQRLEPLTGRSEGQPEWTTAVTDGSDDLLEELRALYLRAEELAITWTMAVQAAKALRDEELLMLATECQSEPEADAKWFTTRIKTGAPQALVVG
jgi:Lon protease-like protein